MSFYSWSFSQLILQLHRACTSGRLKSRTWIFPPSGMLLIRPYKKDNSSFIIPDIACLYKVLALCHYDRNSHSLGSCAIPQRHFQSRYFAQNKPSQTANRTHITCPKVSNLTLGCNNIHSATKYHCLDLHWEKKLLQERSALHVKRLRLPLSHSILYYHRQKWIDPRHQTPGSLKGQRQ